MARSARPAADISKAGSSSDSDMPYKNPKARKLYGQRWRAKNRLYMTTYGKTYYATFCQRERPKKYKLRTAPITDGLPK